eukprot:1158386-Pelagomonas_calceolata.AAC.1
MVVIISALLGSTRFFESPRWYACPYHCLAVLNLAAAVRVGPGLPTCKCQLEYYYTKVTFQIPTIPLSSEESQCKPSDAPLCACLFLEDSPPGDRATEKGMKLQREVEHVIVHLFAESNALFCFRGDPCGVKWSSTAQCKRRSAQHPPLEQETPEVVTPEAFRAQAPLEAAMPQAFRAQAPPEAAMPQPFRAQAPPEAAKEGWMVRSNGA